MQAISCSLGRFCRPIARHSLSSISKSPSSGRSGPLFRPIGPLYHVLLILIIILCLSPVSTLAQPAPLQTDLTTDVPQPASPPRGGEMIDDDLYKSPFHEDDPDIAGLPGNTEAGHGSLERRIVTANKNTATKMPTPFDTLSNNFANTSCVKFVSDSLKSDEVTSCHPVSLLLQNSNSFFHTLSSAAKTSRVLDTTCSASLSSCASTMTSMAKKMLQKDNCGPDYEANNSFVHTVYRDLMAYEPMFRATCLTNPKTNNYCFVDAVTNTSAPNSYDVYFVPLGNILGSGNVTCDQCLQATTDIFAHWATVDGQSLDTTYVPSARVVNHECGAHFANVTLTTGTDHTKASAGLRSPLPDFRITASFGLVIGGALAGIF